MMTPYLGVPVRYKGASSCELRLNKMPNRTVLPNSCTLESNSVANQKSRNIDQCRFVLIVYACCFGACVLIVL